MLIFLNKQISNLRVKLEDRMDSLVCNTFTITIYVFPPYEMLLISTLFAVPQVSYSSDEESGVDDNEAQEEFNAMLSTEKKDKKKKKNKKHKKDKKNKQKEEEDDTEEANLDVPSAADLFSTASMPAFLADDLKAKQQERKKEQIEKQVTQKRLEHQALVEKQADEDKEKRRIDYEARQSKKATTGGKRKLDDVQAGGKGVVDPFAGLHTKKDGKAGERHKKVKDAQQQKVGLGQSFEGRTWKSEAEMVMRQQFD